MEGLIGFVFEEGCDDYTVWTVDLPEEEKAAIVAILERHVDEGCSVRGNGNMAVMG